MSRFSQFAGCIQPLLRRAKLVEVAARKDSASHVLSGPQILAQYSRYDSGFFLF